MKKTKAAHLFGGEFAHGKRGSALKNTPLVDKAEESPDLGTIPKIEKTRISEVDVVHRFGKKSGSS